jgi:hypothetical protein
MFSLMVVDHVRLDSEHVAQNYAVHARAAERLVRVAFALKVTLAFLLVVATGASIVNLLFQTRASQIAAIAAAALALVAFALSSVFGLDGRIFAHRSFAHRLWLVSERYRSLMAEINEGQIDRPALLRRRDDLIHELHAIYEHGFGVDQPGYENARLPVLPSERAA